MTHQTHTQNTQSSCRGDKKTTHYDFCTTTGQNREIQKMTNRFEIKNCKRFARGSLKKFFSSFFWCPQEKKTYISSFLIWFTWTCHYFITNSLARIIALTSGQHLAESREKFLPHTVITLFSRLFHPWFIIKYYYGRTHERLMQNTQ